MVGKINIERSALRVYDKGHRLQQHIDMLHRNSTSCSVNGPEQVADNDFVCRYPELFTSISLLPSSILKCEGRVLRKDTERVRKFRRYRRQPNYRRKQFEAAFFRTMDHKTDLFTCPVCRQVLKGAITVKCGHTFCGVCLDTASNQNCPVCRQEFDEMTKRSINVLVQELVEKWRERNRQMGNNNDRKVPDTVNLLRVEPRYHLRSRYAGLQVDSSIEDWIMGFFDAGKKSYPKYEDKRILKNSNLSNTFSEKWFDQNIDNCDHFEDTLRNVFKEIDDIKDEALKSSWDFISISDLECILCSRCLLDPVTTDCGHTFCRGCLTRVLDHGLSCPLCMAALNVADYSRGSTVVLQQAIQFLVPEDFKERVSLSITENLMLEKSTDLPVFVCTNAFPGVACPLYVYEPRYRLLARRCLRSSTKRFAMAGRSSGGVGGGVDRFQQVGTVLELKDAVSLQDGRFILTTLGIKRFRVIAKNEQDGYDTATVQYIYDTPISIEKQPELHALHAKVYAKAFRWIHSLKPRVLAEVERLIGRMPKVEDQWWEKPDGPKWAWWLMPILPLSSQLQVGFLSTTSLEKRLRAIDKMLEHMKIRMRALERNTVTCAEDMENTDTCSENERSFEMQIQFTDS